MPPRNSTTPAANHPAFGIGTFRDQDGEVFAGVVVGDRVGQLESRFGRRSDVRSFLEAWDDAMPELQAAADAVAAGRDDYDLDSLDIRPPYRVCGPVFQAGANYRTHMLALLDGAERRGDNSDGLTAEARESARAEFDERARTGRPFVFLGSPHAVSGARDDIVLPAGSEQHDWELELAAVIGRRARNVPRKHALDVVAGYTICDDITTRDALARLDARAMGLDWLAGKNSPTFLPTGPVIVPAVHVPDPMDLRISLRVNGRPMQDGTTADMLFDIAALIEHVSRVTEMHPGDLLLTGSPAGNGASHGIFLQPGDVIEGAITGLGSQRNRCVAEADGTSRARTPAAVAPRRWRTQRAKK
jgi:2-keto-4-pentenoate hydratase/2-oxohepta-3-ene-1,7-dioic acid hydratase in catechol pathway